MSFFTLRTDQNNQRWEIRRRADGTHEHRREGRGDWLEGWPSTLSRADAYWLIDTPELSEDALPKDPLQPGQHEVETDEDLYL